MEMRPEDEDEEAKLYNGIINDTIKAAQKNNELDQDFFLDDSARIDLFDIIKSNISAIDKELDEIKNTILRKLMMALISNYLRGYKFGITQAEGK